MQKIFFPSNTSLWNGIDDSIRETESLGIFKKSLTKLYRVQSSNSYLNVAIDRSRIRRYYTLAFD